MSTCRRPMIVVIVYRMDNSTPNTCPAEQVSRRFTAVRSGKLQEEMVPAVACSMLCDGHDLGSNPDVRTGGRPRPLRWRRRIRTAWWRKEREYDGERDGGWMQGRSQRDAHRARHQTFLASRRMWQTQQAEISPAPKKSHSAALARVPTKGSVSIPAHVTWPDRR